MIRTLLPIALVALVAPLCSCKQVVSSEAEPFGAALGVQQKDVRTCYELLRTDDPALAGKIEVAWTVQTDGAVADVNVSSNNTGSDELASCVVRRVHGWQFEQSEEDRQVTHAFTFQ